MAFSKLFTVIKGVVTAGDRGGGMKTERHKERHKLDSINPKAQELEN